MTLKPSSRRPGKWGGLPSKVFRPVVILLRSARVDVDCKSRRAPTSVFAASAIVGTPADALRGLIVFSWFINASAVLAGTPIQRVTCDRRPGVQSQSIIGI